MPIIQLEGVEKSYGSHEVLKGVNLDVEEGEIYGILGPNGVGKTTLFQTVIGLLQPDNGAIIINGDEHNQTKRIKKNIGYLPSDISFYENMTARNNLRFFADLAETDPNIPELLELVKLSDDADRDVGEFSTGMKKRLGIAQALIKDPEILIFDEPTTGLDPQGKRNFRVLVKKVNNERNKTVIISSHITTEIEPLCHRFAVLYDGKVVASGTKEDLNEHTEGDYRIEVQVEEQERAEEMLQKEGFEIRTDGLKITVVSEEDERDKIFGILVDADVGVRDVGLREETLETAYLKLTESDE